MSVSLLGPIMLFLIIPILLGIGLLVFCRYRGTHGKAIRGDVQGKILVATAIFLFIIGPLLYYGLAMSPGKVQEGKLRMEVNQFFVRNNDVYHLEYGIGQVFFNVTGLSRDFNHTPVSSMNYTSAKDGERLRFSFESDGRFVGDSRVLTGTIVISGHDSIQLSCDNGAPVTVEGPRDKRTVRTAGTDAELTFIVRISWPK